MDIERIFEWLKPYIIDFNGLFNAIFTVPTEWDICENDICNVQCALFSNVCGSNISANH